MSGRTGDDSGRLSPLLRGWWPEVVVAPPVRVHALVVQITFLLFAVVARVVLSVVWVFYLMIIITN